MSSACCQFWTRDDLAVLLPRFFQDLYSTMHCSMSLMHVGCERARLQSISDPVAARLVEYLTIHIKEEAHHEEWLLDDLDAIGMDRKQVVVRPPSMAVAALVGSQYCWIEHAHPVALLGYLIVLEGTPPTAAHLRDIQERTGFRPEAFRCLLEHADQDPHHIAELNELLDTLPLRPYHSSLIAMSAFQTIEMLARLFEDLLEANVEQQAAQYERAG